MHLTLLFPSCFLLTKLNFLHGPQFKPPAHFYEAPFQQRRIPFSGALPRQRKLHPPPTTRQSRLTIFSPVFLTTVSHSVLASSIHVPAHPGTTCPNCGRRHPRSRTLWICRTFSALETTSAESYPCCSSIPTSSLFLKPK